MSVTYSATENVHFGLIMDVLSYAGLKILLYTFLSKMFNCFLSLFVVSKFLMHMSTFCLLLCSLVLMLVSLIYFYF
jgi:hypothetical protein